MSLIILNVDEVRRTLSTSGGAFVTHDKEVDIVRFAINSGFADIVLDGQVALRVMYQRPGETEVRAQTLTYYDTDGLHTYYDWQLLSADLAEKGTLTVALCILRTDGDVEEWHTTPCQIRVLGTIHTDDSDEGDETITPTVAQRVAVLESMIQRVASGAPIVVSSTSAMTDTEQIYVLSTDGNWYYHNGATWTAGGEYGAVATDTTLTQSGMPADAKAVGDELTDVKSAISDLDNGLVPFHPNTSDWYRGYFNSTGTLVSNNTNAAPINTPFQVASGDVLKLFPEGLVAQVQTYTYSGGTYTRVTNNNYSTDQTITFSESTYVSINVRKSNNSTLPLSDVTTKIYFVSNIEKKIDAIDDTVYATNSLIGSTPMGTDANTLTGAIAEHNAEIAEISADISAIGYEKGSAVSFQTVNNASSFVLDKPNGCVLVESTDAPIFTGTINNIDLLGIKQGVFTDATSGVTIEVTGNEVYVHGTTTAGFRFDFQQGLFYTDSFANHPADLDILPACTNGYRLCFFEKSGYSMPSNIYIAALNKAGTAINPNALKAHNQSFYKNGTYIAMYSNVGISGINVKFTLGLKVLDIPGTIAGIEAVPKTEYNTTVISGKWAGQLGQLTWTGENTQYEAYQLLKENELTKGHVFAWFGDSISQLRELPNLVSALIGATVYDCSFAGAPLTYGNPIKYQPTGFMSLCSQIVDGDFTQLSDALDAQESAGVNVTEKRQHLATLQVLDFDEITDIVVLAGTNDFDNDYVNATNFVSGFSSAITTLLTTYPHLIIHVLSPIWRGDKSAGVVTIPTMPDLINLEKEVADSFNLPFADLYHTSGINSITASVYLESDILHLSAAGDSMLANKCAKILLSN